MYRLLTLLLTTTLHLACSASDLDLLPVKAPVSARVMQLGTSPEIVKITERLGAAMARQPQWARAYVEQHKAVKGPLPWHANMGISRAEYDTMLQTPLKLMQAGTVELSAIRQSDGALLLRTRPRMPHVDGIVIDADGKAATTGLARLVDLSQVDNRNAAGPTGRWTGTQWQHAARTDTRILGVKLALGKRQDHGDGILYLDVNDIGEGKKNVFYEILLFPVGQ